MKLKFQQGEIYAQWKICGIYFSFACHEIGGDIWVASAPRVGTIMDW